MGSNTSRITLTQLRQTAATLVDRVQSRDERVIIQRRRKPAAAVVSMEDLAVLEKLDELQDRRDIEEAERVLADPNTKWIPWEQVKAELDAIL